MALNHSSEKLMVKQEAVDALTRGDSISIPFTKLAVKLPGWGDETEVADVKGRRVPVKLAHNKAGSRLTFKGSDQGILAELKSHWGNEFGAKIMDRIAAVNKSRVWSKDFDPFSFDRADRHKNVSLGNDREGGSRASSDEHSELKQDSGTGEVIETDEADLDSLGDLDDLDSVASDWWEEENDEVEEEPTPSDCVPCIHVLPPIEDLERLIAEEEESEYF